MEERERERKEGGRAFHAERERIRKSGFFELVNNFCMNVKRPALRCQDIKFKS